MTTLAPNDLPINGKFVHTVVLNTQRWSNRIRIFAARGKCEELKK